MKGISEERRLFAALGETEAFLKGFGLLAIALYVLGLIAINGYLFSLGVSDFSLVRAKFVYTGTLLTAFGVLPYMFVLYSQMRFRRKWGQDLSPNAPLEQRVELRQKRREATMDLVVTLLLPIGVILAIAFIFSKPPDRFFKIGDFVGTYAASVYLGFMTGRLISATHKVLPRTEPVYRIVYSAFVIFLILLFWAGFIALFTSTVFPKILEQFGGGRPTEVRLLIKGDSLEGAKQLGLPIKTSAGVTETVSLLYEGNNTYVVRIPQRRVIRLDRAIVEAVSTEQ